MATYLLKWLMLLHPFYVSVAEITYDPKDKELEISIRIFTNDFEKTLKQNYPAAAIDLLHPANLQATNQWVKKYIDTKFEMALNGKKATLQFIGFEQVEESIWCYFTLPVASPIRQLHISNRLLYDYKKEQNNLINLSIGSSKQSTKLSYPDTEVDFAL